MLKPGDITFNLDGSPLKVERCQFIRPKGPVNVFKIIDHEEVVQKGPPNRPTMIFNEKYPSDFIPGNRNSWMDVFEKIEASPGVTIEDDSGREWKGPPIDKKGKISRSDYLISKTV